MRVFTFNKSCTIQSAIAYPMHAKRHFLILFSSFSLTWTKISAQFRLERLTSAMSEPYRLLAVTVITTGCLGNNAEYSYSIPYHNVVCVQPKIYASMSTMVPAVIHQARISAVTSNASIWNFSTGPFSGLRSYH